MVIGAGQGNICVSGLERSRNRTSISVHNFQRGWKEWRRFKDFLEECWNELTSNLGSGVHERKGPCSLCICTPGPGPKFHPHTDGAGSRDTERCLRSGETSGRFSTQDGSSEQLWFSSILPKPQRWNHKTTTHFSKPAIKCAETWVSCHPTSIYWSCMT